MLCEVMAEPHTLPCINSLTLGAEVGTDHDQTTNAYSQGWIEGNIGALGSLGTVREGFLEEVPSKLSHEA